MKIIRFNCCGMDVYKNSIVATIGINDRDTQITQYIQKTFSTLNTDLLRLKQWLLDHDCFEVCMESTGKYWIPIFNIWEDTVKVHLTHPKYVKAIKGKKPIRKIQNGFVIFSNTILSSFLLFLQRKYKTFVRLHAIVINLSVCAHLSIIVIKIAWQFLILVLVLFFLIRLESRLKPLWKNFLNLKS